MLLGEIIKKYRESQRLSLREFANKAGLSHAYIDKLEAGIDPRTQKPVVPTIRTIKMLAKAMGISLEELMARAGYTGKVSCFTKPISAVCECKAAYTTNLIVKIPVVSAIRAGEPIYTNQDILGYEVVPISEVKDGESFYFIVQENSMSGSRIHPGDKALIRRQDVVESGRIAVVSVNNKNAILRRLKYQNGLVILYADNPKYEPQIYKAKEVKVLGQVVKVIFEPK